MGLQARVIVERLGDALWPSVVVALAVLGTVVVVRFAWVMGYGVLLRSMRGFLERHAPDVPIPSARVGVLASWCGMRGLVTLATAFALPDDFAGRDTIVLSAFVVVLGTLVLQGFTIRPLVQRLRIAPDRSMAQEISRARVAMLDAALATLTSGGTAEAAAVRAEYAAARTIAQDVNAPQAQTPHDKFRVDAIVAQRRVLVEWRSAGRIDDDTYHRLEEELDHAELNAADSDEATLMRV
jgi:CPA1 family monovalent cation:H+ antiporter